MTTVTRPVQFRPGRGRRRPQEGETETALGRVPRVARLMALAIKFDRMIRDGVVANQSELAELARVTQPRMTQIMNLLHLAPDIQEEILFLATRPGDQAHLTEGALRGLAATPGWRQQREARRTIRRCVTGRSRDGADAGRAP